MLRLILLLVNVYDTYKALKPPGRTSARAATIRKRAMKGCVCSWIVWGCCALLESIADRTVGWVIPFYGTTKNVFVLLLLVGRTRTTEPIYLHIIRPAAKAQAPMLDIAFYVLDAIFSILLFVLLTPALVLWEHVLRPVFQSAAPSLSRATSFNPLSYISRRGTQLREGLKSRTVEDMQEAVDAAHAVYDRIEELQERVRVRRDHREETGWHQEEEVVDAPQLRVRRKNAAPQPRHRPPGPHHDDYPPPPPPPPKDPANGVPRRPPPPATPPPPEYTERPLPTPPRNPFNPYPTLPPESDLSISRTMREAFSTPRDVTAAFPTLATIDAPSDEEHEGQNGRSRVHSGGNDLHLQDFQPSPAPSHRHRSSVGIPQKRAVDGSPVLAEEDMAKYDDAEAEEIAEDGIEENLKKRRRVVSERAESGLPTVIHANGDKKPLGPPRRIPVTRLGPGQDVEVYRRTASGSAAVPNGKGKERDYGDGVELVQEKPARSMPKSATSADLRRQPARKRNVDGMEAGPVATRNAQSKDDLRKPPAKRRVAEAVEEDEDKAGFGTSTRGAVQRRTTNSGVGNGLPMDDGGISTRTRAGLGRQGAIAARGGRGRGRSVSGAA